MYVCIYVYVYTHIYMSYWCYFWDLFLYEAAGFLLVLLSYNWHITLYELKCTIWFDTHIYYEMIITNRLVNSSISLATWFEELTHWERPRCWERLKAGGEGDDRGWDGWMASLTQWTWVWASPRSWWWSGKPGVLQSMGSQRVRHDWATELNWNGAVN